MPNSELSSSPRALIRRLHATYRDAPVAVKASLWFALCSFIQKGISVLTMPIFTRLMSTAQYGQYNVYLSWYNILTILVSLNLHAEIFNKGMIDHAAERDAYSASQAGLLLSLAAGWIAVYLLFQDTFNRMLGLTTVLAMFMILEIVGSSLVGIWTAQKRFVFDYRSIVRLTLTMSVANPIVGVAAVLLSEHKAEARLIANAVVPMAAAVGVLLVIIGRGKLFAHRRWWKPAVLAALPLIPHYLSLVLLNQSDKLMIDHFTGASDAAIYSVAHAAGLLLTIVNSSINNAYVPWSYEQVRSHGGEGVRRVSAALLALVALVNVMLIWLAPEAVRFLAPPQYAEAIWSLAPIAMSVFFFFAYTLFVDMEIYYGANYLIAAASIIAAALNIALNAVCIPAFGYIAAAYTTLASYFATMLLHLLFLYRVMKKQRLRVSALFDLRMLAVLTAAMSALSACGMLLYRHTLLRLVVVAAAAVALVIIREPVLKLLRGLKRRQSDS